MKFEKEFRKDNPQTAGERDSGFNRLNYIDWIDKKYAEAKAGHVDTIVIGLPPLKEMENEILEALENLDIIVHADEPMIGNRFAREKREQFTNGVPLTIFTLCFACLGASG